MSRARPIILLPIALAFSLALNAYLFAQGMLGNLWHGGSSVAQADLCDNPAASQEAAVNPNKMLFVSCGGFID